jgi:quinol monooxygenase YgiN
MTERHFMYGLIGKMKAVEGQRDALAAILLEGLRDMPGNLSYIVAVAPDDPNTLWITEVWTDAEAHKASLSLPSVQAAIGKGRPLIVGLERVAETAPLGGAGLPK